MEINSRRNANRTDRRKCKRKYGSIYKYTIRAIGEEYGTLSGCRGTGRTMARLSSRTLNSAKKASASSIKCSWNTTSQATGTKTFTGLKAGQNYKIQVRSYKKVAGVGIFYSAWSTEKYVKL